jgi:hypothetical protein
MAGRYGAALLLLIVALVYTMAVQEGEWRVIAAMALQGLALVAVLRASRTDSRLVWALTAFFVFLFIAGVVDAIFVAADEPGFVRVSILAIVLGTLPVIAFGLVRQVKAEQKITVQTMMGVLCAYLLITTVFAYSYAVLGEFGDGPFFSQGEQWNQVSDYLYYSLITITTVGMGDLTPATQVGRSLTAAEALVGQIYMVTVVAVIVSNLGRSSAPKVSDQASRPDREKG